MTMRGLCALALVVCVVGMATPVCAQAPIVSAVHFAGNQAVPRGELKAQMVTRATPWYDFLPWTSPRRFDPLAFIDDLQRLRSYYQNRGYLSVAIDSSLIYSNGRIQATVKVVEGPLTRIRSIEVSGAPDSIDNAGEKVLKQIHALKGEPFARREIAAQVDLALHWLRDNGYAFATVEVDPVVENQDADLTFLLSPGPMCRIDEVRVQGNAQVSRGTVLRGVTVHSGDLFRESDLQDSQRQLYRAGVFRSVTLGVPDSVEHVSPVDVMVHVSERPFHSLKLGGAFDTDDKLQASAEWTHRNFWGDARQVQFSTTVSARARNAVVGLRQPYFFSSRNWLTVSSSVQRTRQSDYQQDEASGNASLERNLSAHVNLVFQVSGGFVAFHADSTFTEFRTALLGDTRDDVFDPQRGSLIQLAVRERGKLFRSAGEFLQITAEGRWFQPLPLRSVLGLRAQGGVIFELKEHGRVPSIERFFAGGMNSVRGWSLDDLGPKTYDAEKDAYIPVGGLSRLVGSIELRTRWLSFLGTALFLDAGKVGMEKEDILPSHLGWAAGCGVRFLTPVGPLRFDVGYRLSADPYRPARLHYYLSLGQAF